MYLIVGFNAGGSIDVETDGVVSSVPDDMSNRDRYAIWNEWEMAPAPDGTPDDERVQVNTIPPYVEPEPEAGPYQIFKSVFIRRLTSEEAETMEAVLVGADAKLRLMFNSVEFFVSDDPLFETLLAAVGAALGSARAEELLGAEA